MGVEATQFRDGVTRASVRERAGGGPLVENADRDSVEGDGLSKPLLRGGFGVVGDVVECRGGGGQLVGFVIKVLGHGSDAALVDSFFSEVAGHFFFFFHVEAKVDGALDAGPLVGLFTFGRWLVPLQEASESVVDGLVVDEYVDWAFRRGHEVDEGQGLSPLGGLREAMYLGAVVETVPSIVVNAETGSGEKGVRLVGASSVGSGIDPVVPVGGKVRVPFVVPCVRRWARDRLGHRIVGKLGLEIQKGGVFFEEAAVPGVRWEAVPLRR